MSAVAHFFVVVGGSKIHERLAHFFIDIYIFNELKAQYVGGGDPEAMKKHNRWATEIKMRCKV